MLDRKIFSEENSPAFRSANGRSEREGVLSSTTSLFDNHMLNRIIFYEENTRF